MCVTMSLVNITNLVLKKIINGLAELRRLLHKPQMIWCTITVHEQFGPKEFVVT